MHKSIECGCCHAYRYHPARVMLNTFVRWRTLEHKYAGLWHTKATTQCRPWRPEQFL